MYAGFFILLMISAYIILIFAILYSLARIINYSLRPIQKRYPKLFNIMAKIIKPAETRDELINELLLTIFLLIIMVIFVIPVRYK